MRILALLPVATFGAVLQGNVDQMRETFKALAGKKIDDATKTIVRQMLDDILSTLTPALEEDRRLAQKTIDDTLAAVNDCKTVRDGEFSGQIDTKNTTLQGARTTHLECRGGSGQTNAAGVGLVQKKDDPAVTGASQSYGYDTNRHWSDYDANAGHGADYNSAEHAGVVAETSSEQAAYDDQETKCNSLDEWVAGFQTQTQQASCTDTDEVHSWFDHMDKFEAAKAATYKQRREACHEARHNHQHRIEQCRADQGVFEAAFCTYCGAIDTACGEYNTCYARDNATYTNDIATVEDLEEIFKKQQHALECLLCYGEQILEDQTDLSVCDGQPCANCTQLDITYPAPHAWIPCDEECPNRPCTEEFCQIEYGPFTNSDTPVLSCNACA